MNNKHKRIIKYTIEIMGDKEMTTKEIHNVHTDKYNRACPTLQQLAMILKRHKEFIRLNKDTYPATWRVNYD